MNILLKTIIYAVAIIAVMSMPEMDNASVKQENLFTGGGAVELPTSTG